MARRKPLLKKKIIETFNHAGVDVEIEQLGGHQGDPVYMCHYQDSLGNNCSLAPFFSVEKARDGIKKQIDGGV